MCHFAQIALAPLLLTRTKWNNKLFPRCCILKNNVRDFSKVNIKAYTSIVLFPKHFRNFSTYLIWAAWKVCHDFRYYGHICKTVPPLGTLRAGSSLPAPLHFAWLSLLSCLWTWICPLLGKSASTEVSIHSFNSFWKLSAGHPWDPKAARFYSASSEIALGEGKKQHRKFRENQGIPSA